MKWQKEKKEKTLGLNCMRTNRASQPSKAYFKPEKNYLWPHYNIALVI